MYQNRINLPISLWICALTSLTLYYNACSEVSFDKEPTFTSQKFSVNSTGKVDILVIMDNSGSMGPEMASMAARFGNFSDKIKYLDWQLGITTTDNRPISNGKLLPLIGTTNKYILKPSMNNIQKIFSDTIQMPTDGSGAELGLAVAKSAIIRSVVGSSSLPENIPNQQLFRADAALAIILISDAADTSGTTPQQVIDAVRTHLGNKKTFSFHSIVVPQSSYTNSAGTSNASDPCKGYRESFSLDGRLYHQLSQMTGGIMGTVCSEDYAVQLTNIGGVTAELVNSISLNCHPVDSNNDGIVNAADVQIVTPTGQIITGYELHGNRVTFTGDYLPYGQSELTYLCLN